WEGGHHYFVTNARGEELVEGWIPFSVEAASVAILDPMTGRAGMARSRTAEDGTTEVHLRLEPGASLILRTFDEAVQGEAWRYLEPTGEAVEVGGEWRGEVGDGGAAAAEVDTAGGQGGRDVVGGGGGGGVGGRGGWGRGR